MKIVKVTYTTKAEYSEQNQQNIKQVMEDLRELKHTGISYNTCVKADGKTFIHTAFFKSDEDQIVLGEIPSFRNFQEQLKSGGLEISPGRNYLIW